VAPAFRPIRSKEELAQDRNPKPYPSIRSTGTVSLYAQANGKLQFRFIDVGQGDGAILIFPGGADAAFDIGRDMVDQNCDRPVAYYERLGIRKIDYLFIGHYHEDHIGCVASVWPRFVSDKGGSRTLLCEPVL
jgi:beta-lactamase superfamily II metal-dependent hydrolase